MKKLRKGLALFLAVSLMFSGSALSTQAAEVSAPVATESSSVDATGVLPENSQPEEQNTETQQDASETSLPEENTQEQQSSEISDAALDDEAAAQMQESADAFVNDQAEAAEMEEEVTEQLISYLVVGKSEVMTPDTQTILVGLDANRSTPSAAVLSYTNTDTGAAASVNASSISADTAVFQIPFSDAQSDGHYKVTGLDYTIEGQSFHIDMDATGIQAVFGVNVEADSNPDAVVSDEEDSTVVGDSGEGAADITISDADGHTISGDDFKNALAQAGGEDEALTGRGSNGNLVVVIDPGHGGSDSGTTATVNGVVYVERDICLKIAQYCKEELEQYSGVEVYLTRTDNVSACMDREARARFAASKNADVLVSIHINQAGSKGSLTSANGAEVYYPNRNYNAQVGQAGETLANSILAQLTALGLTNRGAKIRNANDDKYPDGSVSDYYGINSWCKRLGFPGIIVEHAFINNASDAQKYLGSDEKLKALGVADAKGIASCYGLSKEITYASDAAKVTVTPGYATSAGWSVNNVTYTMVAENIPKANNMFFAVYNGKSDVKWYYGTKSGDNWVAMFNVSDFGVAGTYYVDAYVVRQNGSYYQVGRTMFDAADFSSDVQLGTVSLGDGTSFVLSAQNVPNAGNATGVRFAVWHDGLSDMKWFGAMRDGARWLSFINVANYGRSGMFMADAYVDYADGTSLRLGNQVFFVPEPTADYIAPYQINEIAGTFDVVVANATAPAGVDHVRIAAWTAADLSDLYWYDAYKQSDGVYVAQINVANHAYHYGVYAISGYIYGKNGVVANPVVNCVNLEMPQADIQSCSAGDGSAYFLSATNVPYNGCIIGVQFGVWHDGLSDLQWYGTFIDSYGRWMSTVGLSNYAYKTGTYGYGAYAVMRDGTRVKIANGSFTVADSDTLYTIMGQSSVTVDQMVNYYNKHASYPSFYASSDAPTIQAFCQIYLEECQAEGVKTEVAFSQAMKETGYLKYRGDVKIGQYNFAGLGAVGGGACGDSFANVREGVRAQVQHLKAYASNDPLVNACVDKRFTRVSRGCAPYVEWLGISENPYGKGWATAKNYGYSVRNDYMKLLLGL